MFLMITYLTWTCEKNGAKIIAISALLTKLYFILVILYLCSKSGCPDTHSVFEARPTSFLSKKYMSGATNVLCARSRHFSILKDN
jgi:hypothetical protein